jgi:hypothetical protein
MSSQIRERATATSSSAETVLADAYRRFAPDRIAISFSGA